MDICIPATCSSVRYVNSLPHKDSKLWREQNINATNYSLAKKKGVQDNHFQTYVE